MTFETFSDFFRAATGHDPYPFQRRLADRHVDFVRVETGLGKTEGLVLGWLWRRTLDAGTPRRLVYVLPMRSLVEQTVERVKGCLQRLANAGISGLPKVEAVIGGDIGENWYQQPEEPWIVVGTQDALLSRALNRGYAMSRFQWAMTFGAINNDAYWVIDEVQLQGIGAVTATQLQAMRDRFGTFGVTQTVLASATLDKSWFESADYSPRDRSEEYLRDDDRAAAAVRKIVDAPKLLERLDGSSASDLASTIIERHRPGTRTLVVVNTVDRAKELFRRIKRAGGAAETLLLHSRFRPGDRARYAERLRTEPERDGPGSIVVATQVVEAGVDITSAILFSETAPWSSMVQRFGRCNRRGDDADARIVWIDSGEPTSKTCPPYNLGEIISARVILSALVGSDLAPSKLRREKINRGPGLVLRSPELLDLFDTSTDLAGHDVDVSPYIRDASDFTVAVFWRDDIPTSDSPARREELCPATLPDLRKLVDDLQKSGHRGDARVANQFGDAHAQWIPLTADAMRPGLLVWLRGSVGRYDREIGFDLAAKDDVGPIIPEAGSTTVNPECDTIDGDRLTEIGVAQTITEHGRYTREEAVRLAQRTPISELTAASIARAALWHDVGKAHDVFQETMRKSMPGCDPTLLWAKSIGRGARHSRKGFRHELPGALVYLAAHDGDQDANLIAFLIAAHHGKFRVCAESLPYERDSKALSVLGNLDGDRVPPVALLENEISPEIVIALTPFKVATEEGSTTWVERVVGLRDDPQYGPFRLAFLELLVRVADWRASRRAAEESR